VQLKNGIILSDSEKKATSVSNYLFENDYVYVTEEGELYLKKTAYFNVRKIATLDPENLDQKIEEFREKFVSLEEHTEAFLNQWKGVSADALGQAEESFNELKKELIEAEAVGDFESLVGKLDTALDDIKQKATDSEAEVNQSANEADQKETEAKAVTESEKKTGKKKTSEDEPGRKPEEEKSAEVASGEEEKAEEKATEPAVRAEKTDSGEEAEEQVKTDAAATGEKEADAVAKDDEPKGPAEKSEIDTRADDSDSTAGKKPEDEVQAGDGDTEEEKAKTGAPSVEDEKAGTEASADETAGKKPEDEVKAGDTEEVEAKAEEPSTEDEMTGAEARADEPEARGEESEEEQVTESGEKSPEEYYGELAAKAEQLIELTDWPYVSMELSNIDNLWAEGPDPGEVDISSYRERIEQAKQTFEERKEAHYEEQRRIKAGNLEKKKNLLKELKTIISEENWTATKEVGSIRNKWDQIKPLPAGKAEELQPEFDKLIAEFEDHKVDRLVKKKQKEEENLIGKLVVLDKMDGLLKSLDKDVKDWPDAETQLEKLNKQWRKIGRVPIEKNKEVWDRYHDIQDRFHQLRFKHDNKYRQQIEKFLSRKKKLIKEAEALIDDPDLAAASRQVNKLHRRWKKVGNLPQKDENELWDQFKAATDAFNDKKSENLDQLREQEDQNLEEKKKLIQEAEELKDSEEWEATHDKLQQLMKKWKKIGPVPKRKSGKIWKQFKGAMDVFYDRRREHFKEVKEDRKENLEEKQEILNKLKALKDHENPIEAVEEAKPLQEEFKKAGYVPIKHKNKMWKEYRETCDVIYDRFRAAKSAANVVGKENVSDFSTDDIAEIQKMQKEASRLRKEINKTHNELIQMKESLSYFKPSGKGSSLLDEVHKKVENAEEEIEQKEEKLAEIEKKIDQLKRDS